MPSPPLPSSGESPHEPLPPPVDVRLWDGPEHPCVYLPSRTAISRAFLAREIPPELYHDFMNAGFRRSGTTIYQPICRGCRACVPVRVSVERFRPNKSQRRCRRRNQDIEVSIAAPQLTEEKFDLYKRYVAARHGNSDDHDWEFMESFLYDSPVQTIECCYRLGGRLVGVGICDVCARSLSTVYLYFDPDESRRSLGTFGALVEIELARRHGIPYYYLGYWVAGCGSMEYKASFRPHEFLHPDGVWRESLP